MVLIIADYAFMYDTTQHMFIFSPFRTALLALEPTVMKGDIYIHDNDYFDDNYIAINHYFHNDFFHDHHVADI